MAKQFFVSGHSKKLIERWAPTIDINEVMVGATFFLWPNIFMGFT